MAKIQSLLKNIIMGNIIRKLLVEDIKIFKTALARNPMKPVEFKPLEQTCKINHSLPSISLAELQNNFGGP